MVRLIDDLLDVSRITSGKIQLQRQPTLLGESGPRRHGSQSRCLGCETDRLEPRSTKADPCVLDVDPTRFVQILSNLLHNATKFTNDAGWCASPQRSRSPRAMLDRPCRFSVADSGVGISPELLPRVFDLFTQGETRSSQPGLGIGLALARRLIELHAGRLDGHSEGEGRGSEFLIHLPLATTQSITATKGRADDRRLERRILVIDDNEDAANATAMLIEEMGGEARVAYNGEDALDMLLEYNPK